MARNAFVQKMFPQVTSVVDAKRPRLIEVAASDLKHATVQSHKACAMAVACKRKLRLDGVIMGRKTAYLIRGRKATRYAVPESVAREIVAFDRGARFEPGVYRLMPHQRPLGTEKVCGPHASTGQPRRYLHVTTGVRALLGSEVPAEA